MDNYLLSFNRKKIYIYISIYKSISKRDQINSMIYLEITLKQ